MLTDAKLAQSISHSVHLLHADQLKQLITRMWANAQPDGRPAEHTWSPLFNAAKSG